MTLRDSDPEAALAEALSEYAELIAKFGPASTQTRACFERARTIPQFVELAEECRRLEESVHKRPAPARRKRGLFPALATAAFLILFGSSAALLNQVNQARERTATALAQGEQTELRRVRDLVALYGQAFTQAQVSRQNWHDALAAPADLPTEPLDVGPDPEVSADAERTSAAEHIGRAILSVLDRDRSRLSQLQKDADPAVRQRAQEILRLLDAQGRRWF